MSTVSQLMDRQSSGQYNIKVSSNPLEMVQTSKYREDQYDLHC